MHYTTGAITVSSQSSPCMSYTFASSYTWAPTTDVTNFNLYPDGDQAKGITFSTQLCSIYSNPTGFSCPATNDYRLTISGPNATYVSPTCVMSGRWATSVSPPIYLHHFAPGAQTSGGCSLYWPIWLTTSSGVVYSRQTSVYNPSLYYPSHATWCSTQMTLSEAASPTTTATNRTATATNQTSTAASQTSTTASQTATEAGPTSTTFSPTTTPQDPTSSPTSTAQSLMSPTTRQSQPVSATPGMIFGPTTFLVSPPGTAAPHATVSPLVRPQLFPTSDCQIRTQGAILTLVILLLVL
jgi:hypothetical protein